MITDMKYGESVGDNLIFENENHPDNLLIFDGRDYIQTIKDYAKHNEKITFLKDLFLGYRQDRKHTKRANLIKNVACFTCRRFKEARYKKHLESLLAYISVAGRFITEGKYDYTHLSENDVQVALSWFKVLDDDRIYYHNEILSIDEVYNLILSLETYENEFYSVLRYLDDVRIGTLNVADDLFIFTTQRIPADKKERLRHFKTANVLSLKKTDHIRNELIYLCKLILAVSVSIELYDDNIMHVLYNLVDYFESIE